jgi:hypothetical protein
MGDKNHMAKRSFRIDKGASKLVLRTRAEGMLARLAHDLEIGATEIAGAASSDDGDAWTAELTIPVSSLRVAGALRGDRLDTSALSSKDRAEIERKIREEVLAAGPEVRARAEGPTRERGEATVSIGGASAPVRVSHSQVEPSGAGFSVTGRAEISLRALGVAEVKGPLNAFRVADTIEVLYTFVILPEGE